MLKEGIADMITNTTEKMREFRQPDRGFGYGRKGSSRISNEVVVSLGLPEGDVNALALMVLVYCEAYELSGLQESNLWADYRDYFFNRVKEKREHAKRR